VRTSHGSWECCGGMNVSPYAGNSVAGWLAKRRASLQLFSGGGGAAPDLWSGVIDSRRYLSHSPLFNGHCCLCMASIIRNVLMSCREMLAACMIRLDIANPIATECMKWTKLFVRSVRYSLVNVSGTVSAPDSNRGHSCSYVLAS
jgi:hypothetical protein